MMRLLILVLICAISCGCRDAEPRAGSASSADRRAAVKLSVAVVDDPELVKGIQLRSGEWAERSGGELTVINTTLPELLARKRPLGDLIVYPSRELGELVMRGWLRPVRSSVLADPGLAWSDFFAAIRDQVVRFGGEVYALPLGDPPLVLAGTGTLPEKLPRTWKQFLETNASFKAYDSAPYPLTREFVARAVVLTSPPDRPTLFFDPRSMDARLTTPQLVRALEWMVHAAKGSAELTASVVLPRNVRESTLFPLPIAGEAYSASMDRWEKVENDNPPAVLGFAGRLVSVTASSRNAASAFKLLPWLTSGATGTELSQRSEATLWCRNSQVSQAAGWFAAKLDDDRTRWLSQQLSQGDSYLLPRIPGINRYLTFLEAELSEAVAGREPPDRALAAAQSKWDALTDELGRHSQSTAFNRHLGLSE